MWKVMNIESILRSYLGIQLEILRKTTKILDENNWYAGWIQNRYLPNTVCGVTALEKKLKLCTLYCMHAHDFTQKDINKWGVCISLYLSGVQSAGWLDIHFTVGTSCERAAPLAEKNAVWHHVLRSLISLHNEHCVDVHLALDIRMLSIWKFINMNTLGNVNFFNFYSNLFSFLYLFAYVMHSFSDIWEWI
jgi:hypothetical protein